MKKRSMRLFLLFFTCIGLSKSVIAEQSYSGNKDGYCFYSPEDFTLYTSYSVGKSVGINENYGIVGFFYIPCLFHCNFEPTLDVSFLYFNDETVGANAETGIRIFNYNRSLFAGANIFYGYRQGHIGDFHQLGVNLEFNCHCYEFRANGYFPIGDKVRTGSTKIFDDYDNTGVDVPYQVIAANKEFSLTGIDVEAGIRHCFQDCFQAFTAYAGIGAYYFERRSFVDNLWGAKGKIRTEFGSIFSIEGQVTWDDLNKTEGRIAIELNLPFTLFCDLCNGLCRPCKSRQRSFRDRPVHLENSCEYTTNF